VRDACSEQGPEGCKASFLNGKRKFGLNGLNGESLQIRKRRSNRLFSEVMKARRKVVCAGGRFFGKNSLEKIHRSFKR